MLIRGLLIPAVSLVIMVLPIRPMLRVTESMEYGRIWWIAITAWLLLCIRPVSHLLSIRCTPTANTHRRFQAELPIISITSFAPRLVMCVTPRQMLERFAAWSLQRVKGAIQQSRSTGRLLASCILTACYSSPARRELGIVWGPVVRWRRSPRRDHRSCHRKYDPRPSWTPMVEFTGGDRESHSLDCR